MIEKINSDGGSGNDYFEIDTPKVGASNYYNPDPLMCMSVFKMPTSGE